MGFTFNMKNCVMEHVGQLSSKSMSAYVECGSCGAQAVIAVNPGHVGCPRCGSNHIAQLSMGSGKPDWFKGPTA